MRVQGVGPDFLDEARQIGPRNIAVLEIEAVILFETQGLVKSQRAGKVSDI